MSPYTEPVLPEPFELDDVLADVLTWDDSYAIALALIEQKQGTNLVDVSLNMIYEWTINLPNFLDDRELANEEILKAIYLEWYEEANTE